MPHTLRQKYTMLSLAALGYPSVHTNGTGNGVVIVRVKRKLGRGYMSLSIAPDGMYKTVNPNIRFADLRR